MTPSLIETVARALDIEMYGAPREDDAHQNNRNIARAALQSIEASGYAILPTTLTDEMKQAGEAQTEAWCAIEDIYAALLAARPRVT